MPSGLPAFGHSTVKPNEDSSFKRSVSQLGLATGGDRGQILLVHLATGQHIELKQSATDLQQHQDPPVLVAFSRDSKTFVSVNEAGDFQRWQRISPPSKILVKAIGPVLSTYQAGINNVTFNASADALITVGVGNTVRI